MNLHHSRRRIIIIIKHTITQHLPFGIFRTSNVPPPSKALLAFPFTSVSALRSWFCEIATVKPLRIPAKSGVSLTFHTSLPLRLSRQARVFNRLLHGVSIYSTNNKTNNKHEQSSAGTANDNHELHRNSATPALRLPTSNASMDNNALASCQKQRPTFLPAWD